jgi:glycosyltransferase involved in cell wall biosynthesis
VSVDKLPEDRIVVIYNGVDGLRFRPDLQVAAKRNELELPEQVPVVGIVARFFPEKAHDVFLAAATVIKQAIPDVHFLLVGDGPRRAGIQELARQLNLDRQCRFTGDRADIPELLCLMNVSVLCSDPVVETFSNTVLESMAAERPVVATRVGSLSEAIVDGETGLLLPPRQPEALAQAVIALLNDPARARQMGVAGRQRVQRLFDLDKMVHEWEHLFENLLQRKQTW